MTSFCRCHNIVLDFYHLTQVHKLLYLHDDPNPSQTPGIFLPSNSPSCPALWKVISWPMSHLEAIVPRHHIFLRRKTTIEMIKRLIHIVTLKSKTKQEKIYFALLTKSHLHPLLRSFPCRYTNGWCECLIGSLRLQMTLETPPPLVTHFSIGLCNCLSSQVDRQPRQVIPFIFIF